MASGRYSRSCRSRAARRLASALVLALVGLGPAFAAEPSREAKQEAKARFVAGQSHYNLNEFSQALVEFKEAYRLLPDPVFLYNSGQCERQLGHPEEAIRFYRSYLREQPKAPNRQDVVHKIDEMEAALKAKAAEAEKAPSAPSEPSEPGKPTASPTEPPPAQAGAPAQKVQSEPAPAEKAELAGQPATPSPSPASLPAEPPLRPEAPVPASPGIDVSSAPSPQQAPLAKAFYSRWWFWTAAGVVAAGAGLGIYAATADRAAAPPASALGSKGVF